MTTARAAIALEATSRPCSLREWRYRRRQGVILSLSYREEVAFGRGLVSVDTMSAADRPTVTNATIERRASIFPTWLKIALAAAALIELFGGIRDFPILLGDTSQIPGPGLSGFAIKTKLALQAPVAGAASCCL